MKRYAPLFIILAASLWSADTLLRKPLSESLPATTIVFWEHAFGVTLLIPFVARSLAQVRRLGVRDVGAIVFIALGGSALATIFFTASFSYVSPSVSILLQKLQPIATILLAVMILKERLPRSFWYWAVLALAGSYLISFPEITPSLAVFSGGNRGILFALVAAFFWGGSTVFGRYVLRKVDFHVMTFLRLASAFVFLVLIAAWQGGLGTIGALSTANLRSLILITLFTGTGALLLYYRGLKETKATVSTVAELFWPLSAIVLNWVFLDEKLQTVQLFGGGLLLFAIWRVSALNTKIVDTKSPLNVQPALAGSEAP